TFTSQSGAVEQTEHVVAVEHADATYVADQVTKLLQARSQPGRGPSLTDRVKLVVDSRLNRVVYYAPQSLVATVEGMIKELDQVVESTDAQIQAFPLRYADAQAVAQTINDIWAEKLRTNRNLKIKAEPISNTIYVAGAMKSDLDELRLRCEDFD